jgi:hypothetical protein
MMKYTFDADFRSVARRLAETTDESSRPATWASCSEGSDRQSQKQYFRGLHRNLEAKVLHCGLSPMLGHFPSVKTPTPISCTCDMSGGSSKLFGT